MTAPSVERDRVIYLDLKRRRRAERASRIMDLTAALTLLFTAAPRIMESSATAGFAYVEAAAAAALMLAVVRELKRKDNAQHSWSGGRKSFRPSF